MRCCDQDNGRARENAVFGCFATRFLLQKVEMELIHGEDKRNGKEN